MSKRVSITMLLFFLHIFIFLGSCNPKHDEAVEVLTPVESQPLFNPTPGAVATSTPSSTSTLVATSTEASIPFNTLTPTSIPIKGVIGLSPEGPWFVYQKENGQLYAVNADGLSVNPLGVFAYGWSKPYVGSLSNGLLAVMVDGEGELSHSVDIILIEFPNLEVKRRISLLAFWESTGDFDSIPEPYSGIMSEPRWSPDGRYLAFVGSIDGPSADLYIYDSTFDQIRRLSSGDNHAEDPLWSPNGYWIIHQEVSDSLGPIVESLWAASTDGDEMKWLFSPEQGWEPWILEWIGEDSFICILRSAGGEQIDQRLDPRFVIVETPRTIVVPEGQIKIRFADIDTSKDLTI